MLKKTFDYFRAINGWLYLILFFCFIGLLRNFINLFLFKFDYSELPTQIFIAMIAIYFSQIVLLLMRVRGAWIISAIGAGFCLYVYPDFTFLPVTNVLQRGVNYFWPQMNYSWYYFIATETVAFLFCLDVIKTVFIYTLTKPCKVKSVKV